MKNKKQGSRGKRIFFVLNIILVVLYLLVCLVPFIDPGTFWFIAVLGLAFPFLFLFLILFLIILLILKSRYWILNVVALLLSFQQLSVLFAFRTEKEFNAEKSERTLRVLSWNVSRWTEGNYSRGPGKKGNSNRRVMMDFIEAQNADVLCLQEFFESYKPEDFDPTIPDVERLGFKYHYFYASSSVFEGAYTFGGCIFSKYPIIDSAKFSNMASEHSEGLSYADIQFNNKRIRIFNTHLESVGFRSSNFDEMGGVNASKYLVRGLKNHYNIRGMQADGVREYVKSSQYPVILCGDIDDVPNSYAYFITRGDLQDTFLEKGSGLGRTYQFISPTLRIDCIFADKKLKVNQFARMKVPYSDHYPLIADFGF